MASGESGSFFQRLIFNFAYKATSRVKTVTHLLNNQDHPQSEELSEAWDGKAVDVKVTHNVQQG